MRSSATAGARHAYVAIGIASSGQVGAVALQECDRRAARAVRRSRTAESLRGSNLPGEHNPRLLPRNGSSVRIRCRADQRDQAHPQKPAQRSPAVPKCSPSPAQSCLSLVTTREALEQVGQHPRPPAPERQSLRHHHATTQLHTALRRRMPAVRSQYRPLTAPILLRRRPRSALSSLQKSALRD